MGEGGRERLCILIERVEETMIDPYLVFSHTLMLLLTTCANIL
jgi:hypothetical protein